VTVTKTGEQVIAIVRIYSGEKWCKVILEDGTERWVRSADIVEEEI
jgi:hypothetical protein